MLGHDPLAFVRVISAGLLARRKLLAFTVATALALTGVATVLAVHDLGLFQLDGNPQVALQSSPYPASDDWDNVMCGNGAGYTGPGVGAATLPQGEGGCLAATIAAMAGASPNVHFIPGAVTFAPDPASISGSTTDTAFTGGGSKDNRDISGWKWNTNGAQTKDDLAHGYAIGYKAPANSPVGCDPTVPPPAGCTTVAGDLVTYFGADRIGNNGSAQVSVWFTLQQLCLLNNGSFGNGNTVSATDPTCANQSAPVAIHKQNDTLVESVFQVGGTTTTANVYKWSADGTAGSPTKVFTGVDCVSPPLTGGDESCATTNDFSTSNTLSPWAFKDKSAGLTNAFAPGEFWEGGADVTTTLGLTPGTLPCFATVLIATRSSGSCSGVTCQLEDFVMGRFQTCSATMATTPSNTVNPVTPGTAVTDTATVTGNNTAFTPSGTVTFYLCSFPVGSASTCSSAGTNIGTDTLSGSNGVATAHSIDVNTVANPLLSGHYCFRASWPGDSNYQPAPPDADGSGECFDVSQIPTSISTAQFVYPNDTATISTGTGTVSGSVAFGLFSNSTCTGTPMYPETVALKGGSASETVSTSNTSVSVDTAGPFYWLVQYTPGDPLVHTGRQSACVENVSPSFTNDSGPGTLYP